MHSRCFFWQNFSHHQQHGLLIVHWWRKTSQRGIFENSISRIFRSHQDGSNIWFSPPGNSPNTHESNIFLEKNVTRPIEVNNNNNNNNNNRSKKQVQIEESRSLYFHSLVDDRTCILGGGFKHIFLCSPRKLGKWSNSMSIFFRWVVQPPTRRISPLSKSGSPPFIKPWNGHLEGLLFFSHDHGFFQVAFHSGDPGNQLFRWSLYNSKRSMDGIFTDPTGPFAVCVAGAVKCGKKVTPNVGKCTVIDGWWGSIWNLFVFLIFLGKSKRVIYYFLLGKDLEDVMIHDNLVLSLLERIDISLCQWPTSKFFWITYLVGKRLNSDFMVLWLSCNIWYIYMDFMLDIIL